MEINHVKNEKIHIIELVGRLDALNNAKFEDFFNKLTDTPDLSVLVDCKNLDFINSSGLRVFIFSLKRLKSINKELILCDLQKNIKDVFTHSGFTNLFNINLTRQEAIKLLE